MDIDNDGVTDLISTGRTNMLLYRHRAGVGFEDPIAIQRIMAEQFSIILHLKSIKYN